MLVTSLILTLLAASANALSSSPAPAVQSSATPPTPPVAPGSAKTGQKFCDTQVCITGVRHGGNDAYTITPVTAIPREQMGWMAIGFGQQMAKSPMVIMWPNEDSSITLSQREATGHIPPEVVASPPRVATLDKGSSFANVTGTTFKFTVPSDDKTKVSLIYAYSPQKPGSPAPDAPIRKHEWVGYATLDLSVKAVCKANKMRRSLDTF